MITKGNEFMQSFVSIIEMFKCKYNISGRWTFQWTDLAKQHSKGENEYAILQNYIGRT